MYGETMTIRFAAIGFAHSHIYGQVNALLNAGAELVSYYEDDDRLAGQFAERFPQAQRAREIAEILEDDTIDMVASATIPNERAPLGIQVMQHGKDYFADKPGITSFEQLADVRRVQAETERIYTIYFGERFNNHATVKAGQLVHEGAIGRVVQMVGFGPHRLLGFLERPAWTFDKQYFGGIINDLASHQIDQFLHFTDSTTAEIIAAQVGNFKHPQFPLMDDYGDFTIRSATATGHIRVDWMTPEGLDTWGDVRLFLLGTDGYMELRKNIDIAGRPGESHLFLVDKNSTRYIDCSDAALTYGQQLVDDVRNRTETTMTQAHCFRVCELALQAEAMAVDLTPDRNMNLGR
ncbi:MAG: gfo/Idh/MocA family oxidoreductase [Chloroflexi bacterium]|nr:MAG: gfo/Idh/MocA family oxidoreductase [Chloroflexota bacterium]